MQEKYVDALLIDLENSLPSSDTRVPRSVFIGGGTPSLFDAAPLARLLDGVSRVCRLAVDTEITLEANPGSAEAERFRAYRAAGVNRLSLGVQSFLDSRLAALGRVHTAEQAYRAIHRAQDSGFQKLNLDLMFGLPEQTVDQAMHDLNEALKMRPTHLSWYQLSLEPNTAFFARPPTLPDEDTIADIWQTGARLLEDSGFHQYEVSSWALPFEQCLHNRNYWEFGDYLGIGAGAHSKCTERSGVIVRTARHKQPARWMQQTHQGEAVHSRRIVQMGELPLEFFMNALRLRETIPMALFSTRTGLSAQVVRGPIEEARSRGLLHYTGDTVTTTERGWKYLNEILPLFMAEDAAACG